MDGGTDDLSTPRGPGRGRRDQGRILRSESGMDLDRDEDNGGGEVLEGMLGDEGDEGDDVRRLSRAWVKERGTQAIMEWEGELMDELFDKLEQQVRMMVSTLYTFVGQLGTQTRTRTEHDEELHVSQNARGARPVFDFFIWLSKLGPHDRMV